MSDRTARSWTSCSSRTMPLPPARNAPARWLVVRTAARPPAPNSSPQGLPGRSAAREDFSLLAGREPCLAQRRDDPLPGCGSLHLHQASRRIGDDAGIGVDRLDRPGHGADAAAAGHVVEMKLHGKLLSY